MTKTYHQQLTKQALEEFEALVDEDVFDREEKKVEKVYYELIRTWQFENSENYQGRKQERNVTSILRSLETEYTYANHLLKRFSKKMRNLIHEGLVEVRQSFIQRFLSQNLRGNYLFPRLQTIYYILTLIGSKDYPAYIGKVSVWDYLESMFKLWGEFSTYCLQNGIQDIDFRSFEEFVKSLKRKYPKYPFKNDSNIPPLKKGTKELEYFKKLEYEIMRVRGIIDSIFYSGRTCSCQGYIELAKSLKKTNDQKKQIYEFINSYTNTVKEKCVPVKNKSLYTDKMGADILKDAEAIQRLDTFLKNRKGPKTHYSSLTREQLDEKSHQSKSLEDKVIKIKYGY